MFYTEEYIRALCDSVKPRKARLGIMYMGGKGELAKAIVSEMPPADVFVDCFGGGGSVTLEALRSGKYKKVIYNEIEPIVFDAVSVASSGERKGCPPTFVRKEDYLLNNDGVARVCFSWNGCWWKYAYQERHIDILEALHNLVIYGTTSSARKVLPEIGDDLCYLSGICGTTDRCRTAAQRFVSNYLGGKGEFGSSWKPNTSSLRLLHLERWNRIEATSDFCEPFRESLVLYNGDYREVVSLVSESESSVIYCDPPYRGTYGYNDNVFDYDAFYNWFLSLNRAAYLSEKAEFPELVKLRELTNSGRIAYNVKHFNEYFYWNGKDA